MKVVVRCTNCNLIKRRSEAFQVRVQGLYRNEASMLEKPNWNTIEEKTWLCRNCAESAGYKVKHLYVLPKGEPLNEKLLK